MEPHVSARAAFSTAGGEALELREIPGPSSFGDDPKRFWQLLWMVSASDFKQTYANTSLGFLWTLIKPLLFFGVIFIVLRGVLRFGANVENYPLILVLGLILFQHFQETTTRAVRSIPNQEGLIRKMQFPRIIVPLSLSMTSAFTMVLSLLAVSPLFIAYGVLPRPEWLLLIPVLLILIAFTAGVALLLSIAYLRFEDTNQIWSLFSRVLFYATPVLFPIEVIPDPFDKIMSVNPLAPLIEWARVVVIGSGAPGPAEVGGVLLGVVVPMLLIVATIAWGFWLFQKEAPRVAEGL